MTNPRKYHHYSRLEEWRDGMWRIERGDQRRANAERAADLMRRPRDFEAAMRRAFVEWPTSCEHNLTAENANRIAWLGHAGCCLGVGSPEENTRIGWHMLNRSEQDEANAAAARVLSDWQRQNVTQMQLFGC